MTSFLSNRVKKFDHRVIRNREYQTVSLALRLPDCFALFLLSF
ncbi:Uncharacterized protein dnm_082130 [Desulfonema magnum]|uniref:Uncharacterized protein n=1 Tax=Desulfonema magnum TaxID=45655 RepID=A0A975BVI1_9BACT|nr:Uncharacterized protein dnm_082130 [Desulfonema magnum]